MQSKIFRKKKSHRTEKILVKNQYSQRGMGSLVCCRGSGHRFCFGRGFDVFSMFWMCVVQVEQMTKK